jgi:transcriptional regulator with XRE-family HTH domain
VSSAGRSARAAGPAANSVGRRFTAREVVVAAVAQNELGNAAPGLMCDLKGVNEVDEDTRVGANVRRCRLWRGMTQGQLAGLAGWTTSAVSMLENGRRGLDSRARLRQLAEALRVAPTELTGEPFPLDAPGLSGAQTAVPALQLALMEHRIGDSDGVDPRPLGELEREVAGPLLAAARLHADDAARLALLPDLIVELQAYGIDERALRVLVTACAEATYALRNVGQVPTAWIAAERCAQAASLLGDPVLIAAAEFTRAHSQPTAGHLMARAARAADTMPDSVVDRDHFAQEVYGMLRLTAALVAQVRGNAAEAASQAEEAARVAELHGERADTWEYFGPANVGVWRTTLALEAGEPQQALDHADAADLTALKPGRRAALLLDTARAHHQLGRSHYRQVVVALKQAEQTAPVRTHASPWAQNLVEVMLSQSRREAGSRDLRGLAFRMGLEA